jgi:hypothetical protein
MKCEILTAHDPTYFPYSKEKTVVIEESFGWLACMCWIIAYAERFLDNDRFFFTVWEISDLYVKFFYWASKCGSINKWIPALHTHWLPFYLIPYESRQNMQQMALVQCR